MHAALAVIGFVFYLLGLLGACTYLSSKSVEDEPGIRPEHFWRYELDARLGILVIMLSGNWPPLAIAVGSVGLAALEASIVYFGWVTHRVPWDKPMPWVRMAQAVTAMGIGFGICYWGLAI